MQKCFSRSLILVTAILIGGCASQNELEGTASVQMPQSGSAEMAMVKQNVRIYDVAPPTASPLGQLNATACDGTQEDATDKLIVMASQRGGNGIAQLSCKEEGMSMFCTKTAICTGTAINMPPPPVNPPPTRRKTTVKKPAHT